MTFDIAMPLMLDLGRLERGRGAWTQVFGNSKKGVSDDGQRTLTTFLDQLWRNTRASEIRPTSRAHL